MGPRAASSDGSSRRRNRTSRRQYQSCDHCRKGRRGCDAFNSGIDTLGRADLPKNSQIRRRGCSKCQRLNKECTFEWLKSVPRDVLPRRLKTKPKTSEQRFRDRPRFDACFRSDDLLPTHNAQQPENIDIGINVPNELDLDIDLDDLSLPENELSLATDDRFEPILPPTLSGQNVAESIPGAAGDFASPNLFESNSFSRDYLHGVKSTEESTGLSDWIQNADFTGQTYRNPGHGQTFETLWNNETYPSRQCDQRVPLTSIDEVQATSSRDQNDLLELEHHQNSLQDLFSEWIPTINSASSRTTEAELLTNRFVTQPWPTVSMQEHRLADRSNKITISNDLMKIYCDSLENALECWVDRETCPYRIEPDVELRSNAVDERTRLASVSKTFYNRVHTLDAVFSRQRLRPLTRAEDSGSSKALKLAIMVFACQWSHSSRSSFTNLPATTWTLNDEDQNVQSRPISDFEPSDAQEFERLLRLSVWHESQRCMSRWSYCGSFRVILASIVLFCSQKPLDEDELNDFREAYAQPFTSQDLGAAGSVHAGLGCLDDRPNLSVRSNDTITWDMGNKSIPNIKFFSSSFYGHEGLHHLETGLRHLLTWRKSLTASHLHKQQENVYTAVTEAAYNGNALPGSHYLSDFNLLFWLGVMGDTTSCVLNQRSLIIPDTETFTTSDDATRLCLGSVTTATLGASHWGPNGDHSQHQSCERVTQSVDIWGSYLLDADSVWRRSLVAAESLSTSQLKSKLIQHGVPLKLLFWRKVGKLQNLIFSREQQPASSPTPSEFEDAIKEALAVHQYWTMNYGEFFTSCTREHLNLSVQSQTWYLVLVLGWNMACLILARYIDFIDGNAMSEKLGQSLRGSRTLTRELEKTSVYAIAEAAKVSSCLQITSSSLSGEEAASLATSMGSIKSSHPVLLGQSTLLLDPHTEKVVKALEMATEVLLDWLRRWRSPAVDDCMLHLSWLHTNTSSDEISRHCASCINALDLLKSKSDVARLTTEHLFMRYSLLEAAV